MKERNIGLDICRIISMIGIVLLHVIGVGGVRTVVNNQYTINYWAATWTSICAYCSVDIFAMMSGFFGINKKKDTLFRAIELIAIVLFYSIVITMCFLIFAPSKITGIGDIITGLFPPLIGRYWYITCFIPVLIFQPFINKMLLSLTKKQHFVMVVIEVLVFSCIPSAVRVDFFRFVDGFSFVWLLLLYSIGAYLGRDRGNAYYKYFQKYGIVLFFIISFLLLFGNVFASKIFGKNPNYMIAYTSPLVLFMGLSVLLTLSDIKQNISQKISGKMIEVLSSTAFDVYIIHSHVLIYDLILTGAFTWIKGLAWFYTPVACFACAIAIFLLCSILGFIRIQLFRIVRFKDLIAKLSTRIDKLLYTS